MKIEEEDQESVYFSRIEEFFIGLRGSPLLLCGKDFTLMKQWYAAGIPLNIVLKGIREVFRQFEEKKPSGKKINSLRYCGQAVTRVWEEAREARIGRRGAWEASKDVGPPEKSVPDHLEKLLSACQKAAFSAAGDPKREEIFSRTLERFALLCESARSDQAPVLEEIEERLMSIEKDIIGLLKEATPPSDLENLSALYRQKIIERAGSVPEETLEGMVEHLLNEKLLSDAGIPRLSLFAF
jgi:hypothetical protein